MEVTEAQFLISVAGTQAVERAAGLHMERIETLSGLSTLRKNLSPDEARLAWTFGQTRVRAAAKLGPISGSLLLDQEGFEMASSAVTSAYHAQRVAGAGATHVLDLCAGLGIDTIAFAKVGLVVTAFEKDSARAILLQENIRRSGVADRVTVVNMDVTEADLPTSAAVFFDPARRSGTRRWVADDADTTPPMSLLRKMESRGTTDVLVKLSPAVDRSVGESYNGDLQFVAVKNECKEALLSLGQFRNDVEKSAVILPTGDVFASNEPGDLRDVRGAYLWEPNAAVIRAGLTGGLAATLKGWQCDRHVDYFFTETAGSSPFAVCYRVLNEFAYTRKGLQQALEGVGKVVLKQRGFPQTIEEVQSKLKLNGKGQATVALTAFETRSYAFVVERIESSRTDSLDI